MRLESIPILEKLFYGRYNMDPNVARPVGRPRTRQIHPEGYDSPESVAARRQYMAAYKAANADHLKAYYRRWRLDHKPEMLEANRQYHARKANAKRLAREEAGAGVTEAPNAETSVVAG